jgi:hypothetical protein
LERLIKIRMMLWAVEMGNLLETKTLTLNKLQMEMLLEKLQIMREMMQLQEAMMQLQKVMMQEQIQKLKEEMLKEVMMQEQIQKLKEEMMQSQLIQNKTDSNVKKAKINLNFEVYLSKFIILSKI